MFSPERKEYSCVLIGDFNPAMFQPEWFYKNNIISLEDVDYARDQSSNCPIIITPQLTVFKTSQLTIKIEQKKFCVIANKEPLISLKDFILKTFEKLSSFIIIAYGFNYSAHYGLESPEIFQMVGDRLAPKQYWKRLLKNDIEGVNRKSGLNSILMKYEKENNEGYILTTLQPSGFIKNGVYINSNNHFAIAVSDTAAEIVMEKLDLGFDNAFNEMKEIQSDLLNEVTKENG